MYTKSTAQGKRNYGRVEHFKDMDGNNKFCVSIYAWENGICNGLSTAHLFDDTLVISDSIDKKEFEIKIVKGVRL